MTVEQHDFHPLVKPSPGGHTEADFGSRRYKNIIQITLKWVGALPLDVMRETSSGPPAGPHGRRPAHSAGRTLLGTAVLAAAFVAAVVVASYPVAAATVVGAAAVTAVATRPVVRMGRESVARRRSEGRSREVCVPATDVCVEA